MPRARWLKPELFRDRKMAELGPIGVIVFQALWVTADDGGMAPCDPDRLKGELFFAWSAVGVPEITGALRHLSALGRVKFYQGGDELFCQIVNWKKHQQVHKPSAFRYREHYHKQGKEFAEVVPEWCCTSEGVDRHSPPPRLLDSKTPRDSLGASRQTQTEEVEVLRPIEDSSPGSPAHKPSENGRTSPKYTEAFEKAWAAYPKRDGGNPKRSAFQAWSARLKSGATPEEILAGVERYARHQEVKGKIGSEFVMQAVKFFGPNEHFREPWSISGVAASRKEAWTPAEVAAWEREAANG